jgi:hypothetical protein
MSSKYLSGSSSPKHPKPSPTDKFLPYSATNKRLTILLSECKSLQNNLADAWKFINKNTSHNKKHFKVLKKQLDQEPVNFKFKEAYKKRKIKQEKEKSSQISDIQKKISNLLKPTKNEEKFPLERKKCESIEKDIFDEFIDFNEMRSPEAVELLKSNKRKFGEQFKSENSQRVLSSFKVGHSGNKKPLLPLVTKTSLKTKQKEFLSEYLSSSKSRF